MAVFLFLDLFTRDDEGESEGRKVEQITFFFSVSLDTLIVYFYYQSQTLDRMSHACWHFYLQKIENRAITL